MKNISAAVWTEGLKIVRSKMLWATILVYLFIPFMIGILMFIQKYPEISAKMGMLGTKASMLTLGRSELVNLFWIPYSHYCYAGNNGVWIFDNMGL